METAVKAQICVECDKEFESDTPRKYCSYECREAAAWKTREERRIAKEKREAELAAERERQLQEELAKGRRRAARNEIIHEDVREIIEFIKSMMAHGYSRQDAMAIVPSWILKRVPSSEVQGEQATDAR